MFKIIKLPSKLLKEIQKETLLITKIILNKKFSDFNEKFFLELKNPKKRSKLFDALNMVLCLQGLNYNISNYLQKNIKKKIINWTYPQIRIDGDFAKKFSAPLHVDKWILDAKLKGFVVWFPINKKGSSLLISKKKNISNIVRDKYWNIKSNTKTYYNKINVKYGNALIFDESVAHKSSEGENRVTVQLRYHILNKYFNERSVNQKINPKVLSYWKKHA